MLGAAIIVLVSILLHLPIGLENDTLTLMHQTGKMLAGGTPYVDFIDINPPLINLIFALPLLFSQATGMPLYLALNCFGVLTGGVSLLLSFRILAGNQARAAIIATLALGLFTLSFMNQLFADREYLVVSLILPLLLLYSPYAERSEVPVYWRAFTALMAGIGFCLKPYALALYAAAMFFRIIYSENPRKLFKEIEPYIMACVGLLYLAIVLIYFREYLRTILPLATRTYGYIIWGWDSKRDIIGSRLFGNYGLVAIPAALFLATLTPSFYSRHLTYLLLLAAGAIGSYALSAGWYYTQYPFMVVALCLLAAAGKRLFDACGNIADAMRRHLAKAAVCIAVVGSLLGNFAPVLMNQLNWDLALMQSTGHPLQVTRMEPQTFGQVETHLATHPRFLFLSFSVWAPYLLDDEGKRESVGRFDYLWPLPGAIQQQKTGRSPQLMEWFAGGIADDLDRKKPDMVISDASPEKFFLPASFDIVDFLSGNARFAEAMKHYRLATTADSCNKDTRSNCAYAIYYRK